MSARHPPEFPDEDPATAPGQGRASESRASESQAGQRRRPPSDPREQPGRGVPLSAPTAATWADLGEGEVAGANPPQWFTPQRPRPRQGAGGAGFAGVSQPGGPGPAPGATGGHAIPGAVAGAPGTTSRGPDGSFGTLTRQGAPGGHEYHGPRRKRSKGALLGPLAFAVVMVVLLGAGLYVFTQRSAGGCSSGGRLNLSVAAAPDIAPAITKAAARFNNADRKVDGRCVYAGVKPVEPAAVTALLAGQGVSPALSRPDVWIPDSSQWTALVRTSDKGRKAVELTRTSVAQSPIVIAIPQTLAVKLKSQGAPPSWSTLLRAASGAKSEAIPAGGVRLYAPDPARTGSGLVSLTITSTLLAKDPNKEATFTGVVRTLRENLRPTVDAQFQTFDRPFTGQYPIAITPEQAVWKHNQSDPAVRAVAAYPLEGTMNLDYPIALPTGSGGGQSARQQAAHLFESALTGEEGQKDIRELGFRSPDGKAPAGYGPAGGVNPQKPRLLPAPRDVQVATVRQAWLKLSLGIRMLALFDISGSMEEKVAPGVTRLQATVRVGQGGVSLFPDDTELGTWAFSTKLKGNQDWLETVPIGPLGQRIGSATRRQLVLSGLAALRPKKHGDTGLYESILAAYRHMARTYKPEFANSIMMLTDGKNDDPGGPSLAATLAELKKLRDPNRPVQVIMIGYGNGIDTNELQQIADVTDGSVHVARSPADVQKIFLRAVSRRTQ